MSSYRDERDALRARNEALERELQEKQREIDGRRGSDSAAERLDKLAHDLEAAQAEIARLRQEIPAQALPAPPSRARRGREPNHAMRAAQVGGMTIVLVGVAYGGYRYVSREPPRAHDVPGPRERRRAPTPPPAPSVVDAPAKQLETKWLGKVTKATGVPLAPGTPCELTGSFTQTSKTRVEALALVCGTTPLYSTADEMNGISRTSRSLDEEPADGGFRHTLRYSDQGDRQGRNQFSVDTSKGVAKAWRVGADALEVEVAIDELGAPQAESVFTDRPASGCERLVTRGRVARVEGQAPVASGAACEVKLRPAPGKCRVGVVCEGTPLYDGYANRSGELIVDDKPTPDDRDPEVHVDLAAGKVRVADKAVTSWSVEVALDTKR